MSGVQNNALIAALNLRGRVNLSSTAEEVSLLMAAGNNGSLEILRDAGGVDIGYVAFANINKYSLLALLRYAIFPKYFYEWSEGNICLIRSVFILPGRSYEGKKKLKYFLRKKRAIIYIKKSKVTFFLRKKKNYYRNMTDHFLRVLEA